MAILATCTQLNQITLNWPTAWVVLGVIAMVTLIGWRLTR